MIPNNVDVVSVQSTLGDEQVKFGVDNDSLGKIMSVLTNLYADPEGAVVREYLTNALDAQIEAQEADPNYVWRPIEVTTPSHFNKSYVVRDFGVGMSVDDLTNVYSKYGKSTKESSNSVTGMLGLGSKCALTYTNQFTITGIKGGIKTKAIISKDEADIPVFMIVDTAATDEPNGVEISVPVRNQNTFADKTAKFLSFWKPGQVLVNGQKPAGHGYDEVKPGVFMVPGDRYYGVPQSYVVMGNVPYAVDAENIDHTLRNLKVGFVAYVDMGSVDFPPSREKLMWTTRTKATVAGISSGLYQSIVKKYQDDLNACTTHLEAYKKYQGFASNLQNLGFTYKGVQMPNANGYSNHKMQEHIVVSWDYQGNGTSREVSYLKTNEITEPPLVIVNVPQDKKPTSYFKKKILHYIKQHSLREYALLVDKDITDVWYAHLPRVDFQTIKDIKLPRNSGPPRTEAPYLYFQMEKNGNVSNDEKVKIDEGGRKTLCYISPNDMRETYRKRGTQASNLMHYLGDDVTLAVMGTNRFEKFRRYYPHAVHVSRVWQQKLTDLVNSSTDHDVIVTTLGENTKEFLSKVTPSDLDDPDLRSLAEAVAKGTNGVTGYERAQSMYNLGGRAEIKATLPERKKVAILDVTKRYPLIQNYNRNAKHLMYYVNAVYQAEHAPKP